MIAAISEDPMSFKVCLSLICYVYLLFICYVYLLFIMGVCWNLCKLKFLSRLLKFTETTL